MIPRAMALRQAGYCERCEWMTSVEVVKATLLTWNTLTALGRRGEWHVARIGRHRLYHRADVTAFIDRAQQRKTAWVALTRRTA
jgi:DNA-binding MarR family transcriptional regulator